MQEISSSLRHCAVQRPPVEIPVTQPWKSGPVSPSIQPSEAHVWRLKLNAHWTRELDDVLSQDDRARAARFRFERDRRRFSVARASLRMTLSRYLRLKPAAVKFESNAFGKPYLVAIQNKDALRFNLSHSHEMALLAVASGREVGIDIEFMRADFATNEIAETFFSRAEIQQLRAVAPELRTRAFFNCWTRKEAYVKARGLGLSLPLDQFDVSLVPGAPAALLDNRPDQGEVSRWSFQELFAAPDYAAALAVEGGCSALRLWDLPVGARASLPA